MTSATYKLEIDTQRNGTYGGMVDNVTNYMVRFNWNEGMGKAYDEIAPPAKMTVVLRDLNGEFSNETLGNETIANSAFTNWTADNPDGWTVTGESGTDPQVSQVGATATHGGSGTGACNIFTSSSAVSISQSPLIIGQSYCITITVSAQASGAIQILNGSTRIAPPIWTPNTYTFYFNATSSTIKIQNWYACDVTIDSFSIKPTALYTYLMRKGTLGRLKVTFNGTTRTMFIGRLINRVPTVGAAGNRKVTLQFQDPMIDMLYGDYKPTLQQNVTINAAIAPIFDEAIVTYPYAHSYWMLGIAGASELGETTTLYTHTATTFDTADSTLDFVGDISDTTGMGINPQMFIQQQVAAEAGGRFFYNPRDGTFTFHRRNRDTLNTTIASTISASQINSDMCLLSYGADLENKTTITFQPRAVGSAGTVVWTASNMPVTIAVGAVYSTTARFQDSTNGNTRMAAKDILTPTRGLDYVATSTSNPYERIIQSIKINGNTAEWVFHNSRGGRTVTLTTLQLRGTPITFYDTKSVMSLNGDSVRDHQLAENSLSIPAISDEDFAQSYADYRTAKFGTPQQNFEKIGFFANESAAHMTNALSLSVGSRITLTENFSGHDADYIVVGSSHIVTIGGEHEHQTTLILKPQSRTIFWTLGIVGYSELGNTTRIAF